MDALIGAFGRDGRPLQDGLLGKVSRLMSRPFLAVRQVCASERVVGQYLVEPGDAFPDPDSHVACSREGIAMLLGRIDNVDDARRHLRRHQRGAVAPAELAFLLYREGGTEALGSLVGDFAIAIWHSGRDELALCTDGIGLRPLYYRVTDEYVSWCSESGPLLSRAANLEDIDEEYVADFLTNHAPSNSPYKDIQALGPGEAFVLTRRYGRKSRYWTFDRNAELRCASDGEYEEQFRSLLTEAVRCRVAGDSPICCELSGGLDSSSIACVAEGLIADRVIQAPCVHTVSYVYKHAASADEERFIDHVLPVLSGHNTKLTKDAFRFFAPIPEHVLPDHPTRQLAALELNDRVAGVMHSHGATVLLSGIGGDQLFWSEHDPALPLADHLVARDWAALLRDGMGWSRHLHWPLWKTLWRGALLPTYRSLGSDCVIPDYRTGAWFDAGFARRTNFTTRLRLQRAERCRRPTQSYQLAQIRDTMRPFALQRITSTGHLDVRFPYLDRRLVSFALALPLEQSLRIGDTRSIVRRSLRGIVPNAILDRRTKSGPGEAFLRALRTEWPRLSNWFKEPLVAALGFVDEAAFQTHLRLGLNGHAPAEGQLMSTLALELWLRGIARRTPSVSSRGDTGVSRFVSRPALRVHRFHHKGNSLESRS